MPDLRSSLSALASQFADEVLRAVRSASLSELVEGGGWGSSGGGAPATRRVVRPRGRPAVVRSNGPTPSAAVARKPVARSNGPAPKKLAPDQIAAMLDKVLALVRTSAGLKNDEIRARVGFTREQMRPVIQRGVSEGKLKRRGHARSTTYTAG